MKYQSNIQKVSCIHEKFYCYFAFFVREVRRQNGEGGKLTYPRIMLVFNYLLERLCLSQPAKQPNWPWRAFSVVWVS